MAQGADKRRFPRVALSCHLRYLQVPRVVEEYRNATVHDLSPGGFRLSTHERFTRRSCFLLDLFLPGSHPIRSLATVAWVRAMPGRAGYQIGGSFVETNPDVETALASLAAKR